MYEFYEPAAAPTEFNYLAREAEARALPAEVPGFRACWQAGGAAHRGSGAGHGASCSTDPNGRVSCSRTALVGPAGCPAVLEQENPSWGGAASYLGWS